MRKFLIAVMIILCVGLGATVVVLRQTDDRKGPEIVFAGDKNTEYHIGMTDEELLEGVTAIDSVDGDVTDSLTVESIYARSETEAVVVYVAKDSSNNVTKSNFVMGSTETSTVAPGTDLKKDSVPEENLTEEPVADEAADEEGEGEETEDLTPEEQAKKTEEAKIDELPEGSPRFYLTTYYLEVEQGTRIDALSFVKDIEDDEDDSASLFRRIQVEGSADTTTSGTSEITYYVVDSEGNESNHAVLTIVVK